MSSPLQHYPWLRCSGRAAVRPPFPSKCDGSDHQAHLCKLQVCEYTSCLTPLFFPWLSRPGGWLNGNLAVSAAQSVVSLVAAQSYGQKPALSEHW